MTTEWGIDYSPYVQGLITPAQANAFAAAGVQRLCLALDTAQNTLQSAVNLNSVGIKLDAYRELLGPSFYVAQIHNALQAFAMLSVEGVLFRRLWLTAEDTSVGTNPAVLVPALQSAVDVCAGMEVGIYSGAWYWPTYMGNTTSFSHLPLWHASYDGQAVLGSVSYGGWSVMNAKQYNSPVVVAGIPVDIDVWSVDSVQPPPPVTVPKEAKDAIVNIYNNANILYKWEQTL